MLTIEEAFRKFKSRLDLNEREQNNASSRHQEIREHLRGRFVVDDDFLAGSYRRHTKTNLSEQIDVVIYDQQYCPFLFNRDDAKYIPAEAVYGAIEVKQELNAENIAYAGEKVASVRRLRRTSAQIPHAGGMFGPKEPPYILGGIVALESTWNPPFSEPFKAAITRLGSGEELQLGCALRNGGFRIQYQTGTTPKFETSLSDSALIFFFFRLLASLQPMGTVPALDFEEYGKVL